MIGDIIFVSLFVRPVWARTATSCHFIFSVGPYRLMVFGMMPAIFIGDGVVGDYEDKRAAVRYGILRKSKAGGSALSFLF